MLKPSVSGDFLRYTFKGLKARRTPPPSNTRLQRLTSRRGAEHLAQTENDPGEKEQDDTQQGNTNRGNGKRGVKIGSTHQRMMNNMLY